MSQENVDLVISVDPAPDVDMAEPFRNDEMWSELVNAVAPLFHPDFETVPPGVPGTEKVHIGLHGLREAWLGWMEPWLTYRTEIKQALDGGDRVSVLVHDYGRRDRVSEEIGIDGSGLDGQGRENRSRRVLRSPLRSFRGGWVGGVTISANLDLVRSIYADWERGDLTSGD